jgi:hypothetical protein
MSQTRIRVSMFILILLLLFWNAGVGHSLSCQDLSCQHEKPQINFIISASINSISRNFMEVNNTNTNDTISSHNNNTKVWIDKLNNIKIQLIYLPVSPVVGNVSVLKFRVQNLQTDNNNNNELKDLVAKVTIINNIDATKYGNVKQTYKGELFSSYDNILAGADGNFSIKYRWQEDGIHPIIVTIHSRHLSSIALSNILVLPIIE